MRIAVGADHAGFELKEQLMSYLRALGPTVVNVWTPSSDPVDYPDYAAVDQPPLP
jgi:ribose 5-phosphate isomerase B